MLEQFASNRTHSDREGILPGLSNGIRDEPLQSAIDFDRQILEEETKTIFLPSQERIKRMCAVYRRDWSEREHSKRSRSRPIKWMVPEVSVRLDSREGIHD